MEEGKSLRRHMAYPASPTPTQPGLELAPELEAPHVVHGPEWQKPAGFSNFPGAHTPPAHPAGYAKPDEYYAPQFQGQHYQGQPYHGQQQQYYQQQQYGSPPGSQYYGSPLGAPASVATGYTLPVAEKPAPATICGLKRKWFLLIFGGSVAIIVLGLAIGLGVGLGTQNNHDSSPSAASASATSSASPTATPSPTPTPAPDPAPDPVVCPSANGTIYTSKDEEKFLVLCNLDYNSGSGTLDLSSVNTTTFEQCMDKCANDNDCVGAGWGNYFGAHTCWMKAKLATSQRAPNWFFAVKQ